jgi:hypothetical protein
MFNFIYGTSGMIEAFKLISAIGKVITITGAVSIFALFELIWGLNKIEGKFVLAPVFITFVGIIVSAIGIGNLICMSNRNIKTAIESDYPNAVMTDMIVEKKTSYGTFQANEAEYCYKVENNQLRIQRRN